VSKLHFRFGVVFC